MTDAREATLIALVQSQHQLIAELRDALRELSALIETHQTPDQWQRDRQLVLVMVAQSGAEAGLDSTAQAWGATHVAADCRRRVALALRAQGWRTARIAKAFGTDPSTIHNLMHRQGKRRHGACLLRAEGATP